MNVRHRLLRLGTTLLVCLLANSLPVNAQQPGWSTTGSPAIARGAGQRAVLLANGRVLIAGASISSELYDPATGQWSVTGSMGTARLRPVLVRLENGKVLAAGGAGDASAEIYDPATGAWSATGSLREVRQTSAGVLLADGRVLVTGGAASASAEVYDPGTGAWSLGGTMTAIRSGGPTRPDAKEHTSTLLPDGRVLVVGGDDNGALRSAELYDPATGRWAATGDLNTPRFDHTATLLPNGKVLVVGGSQTFGVCPGLFGGAEVYDPATGEWSAVNDLTVPRTSHKAVLLPNGTVLVAGADNASCFALASSELYDPATGTWSATGNLKTAAIPLQLVLLANGKVLAVGGNGSGVDLYDSGAPSVTSVSAASFSGDRTLAPESIGSAFGKNLAITTQTAISSPRPTDLAGVTVKIRDRVGAERYAPLLYVSQELINFVVPAGTTAGLATVTVAGSGSNIPPGLVEIAGVAPGLFAANSTGRGAAAGFWIRVAGGGAQSQDYLFDLVTRESVPVDLGAPSDQLFLSLYGTGFRAGASATAAVGGIGVPVSSFAAVPDYQGLDIVTIGPLPRALEGRGEVDVAFSVDGKAANLVQVNIR